MRGRREDLAGIRFGRWLVLSKAKPMISTSGRYMMSYWLCRCDCGAEKLVGAPLLRSGASESCGCLRDDMARKANTTHGKTRTPEYSSWRNMHNRCRNPSGPGYKNYGGRGIRVCDRWLTFENFLADMGVRPSQQHSLDRIDNDGNYEPGNCRWALPRVQVQNRRKTGLLSAFTTQELEDELARRSSQPTAQPAPQPPKIPMVLCHDGDCRTVTEWAGIIGITPVGLRLRLSAGWSVADAVTRPPGLTRWGGRPSPRVAGLHDDA